MLFYIQLRYVLLGWYDVHNSGDFATKITDDLDKLQVNLIFARFRTINVKFKCNTVDFVVKNIYETNQRERGQWAVILLVPKLLILFY